MLSVSAVKRIPFLIFIAVVTAVIAGGQPVSGEHYDLVVAGSEPEGVAAAVACARLGLRTLLVTRDDPLGGTFTLAKLATLDMNTGEDGRVLTRGFFLEFYRAVGKSAAFDVSRAQRFFDEVFLLRT
ncbi:MAG: FAD-dependent oxidoreductase, partial [bacterium]